MANLSLIEVFHPDAVNGGAQASGAIGLSEIHTFRTKTGRRLDTWLQLHLQNTIQNKAEFAVPQQAFLQIVVQQHVL